MFVRIFLLKMSKNYVFILVGYFQKKNCVTVVVHLQSHVLSLKIEGMYCNIQELDLSALVLQF